MGIQKCLISSPPKFLQPDSGKHLLVSGAIKIYRSVIPQIHMKWTSKNNDMMQITFVWLKVQPVRDKTTCSITLWLAMQGLLKS